MSRFNKISESLAGVFVLDEIEEEVLVRNASMVFFDGTIPRWLRPLAKWVVQDFSSAAVRPLRKDVVACIKRCASFKRAFEKGKVSLGTTRIGLAAKMQPGKGAPLNWRVPGAVNLAELAGLLELHLDDLMWLISPHRQTEHYHIRWHQKRGTSKARLIEIPKPLLKQAQTNILHKILNQIPVHEKVCGFCPGKSVIDFVSPHSRKAMVLKMDFKDFFPSISSGRIMQFFMTVGYPEMVSSALTDLCTHAVGSEKLIGSNLGQSTRILLGKRHLPQGAPSSPALANLCSFRLDCRLAGLSKTMGADYTRYADDLLFSGGEDFRRKKNAFHVRVLSIAIEEGFRIHPRKTRFMGQSGKQFAAGLVMNQKPNIPRQEFDELKAILANCSRHGWESQNRDDHPDFRAHLEGRINWVRQSNRMKAEKLDRLIEAITWA